jgi:hypothetical protein
MIGLLAWLGMVPVWAGEMTHSLRRTMETAPPAEIHGE